MIRLRQVVRHPITRVLAVFAVSRAVIVLVLLAMRVVPLDEPIGALPDLLCRFDCEWYLSIARDGYTVESTPDRPNSTPYAFFPLFPALVWALSSTTGLSPLTAGMAISVLATATALVYVYYYARERGFDDRAAMLAVTLLSFAPPSVVFSSAFTEGVFLLLLAAAIYHLRRGEFIAAAVAAALLSATRPTGIAFVAFALVWLLRRYGRDVVLRPWAHAGALLPVVAAPLGLFAYWAFSFVTTGDAFAHVSANFHGWDWGSTNALEMLSLLPRLDPSDLMLAAIGAVTLGLSFLLLRYGLLEEFVFVLATLAIIWTGGIAPWSMPRFALVLFPIFVVVGRVLATRPTTATVVVAAAALIHGFVLSVGWAMEAFVI